MPANSGLRSDFATAEQLLRLKLEYVILTLLLHYGGVYEDSFLEWYSVVKLAVPELSDPQRLRDVFKHLSMQGIIELRSPRSGSDARGKDRDFFLENPFVAALTSDGLVHWVAVRVALKRPAANNPAAGRIAG